MGLESFRARMNANGGARMSASQTPPVTAGPPPPPATPASLSDQLAADVRAVRAAWNALGWSSACRAAWARNVLAVAAADGIKIPADQAPWLAFWAGRK